MIEEAENRLKLYQKATYLLLDECHRWSRTQSDSILPAIEKGVIRFIGSTTENRSFRCRRHREPVQALRIPSPERTT